MNLRSEQVEIIRIRDVDFSYNGSLILEDVDLNIQSGDFVSIVGPNGGGKTTLLKIILGLLKPTRGTVELFGSNP